MKPSDVVKKILNKYPHLPSLTLARKLKQEHPLYFDTVESARSYIRHYRGASGEKRKSTVKILIPKTELPKSYAIKNVPHRIPKSCRKVLVLSDLHIPYHNNEAITVAIKDGVKEKADCVVINGDLLDFHWLSRFQKDPHKRNTKQEFEAARQFLTYLRKMFPRAHIVWNEGNHDARYKAYLSAHALELFNDEYYTMEKRLDLDSLAIHFVPDNTLTYAGKLSISHGHKILRGIFAPVNAARGVFLKTKESHLVGHTHSVSEHTEKRLSKDIITTWSVGCLCELNPDYDPFVSKAAHGYAVITLDASGNYSVRNYRIFNGVRL